MAVNVEVPVRVFKGSVFIDNLKINDFEVYENGILQKIDAVYLIKKRAIQRKEEHKKFTPKTARRFYLLFEIAEYTPRMGKAIDYFIQNILLPEDSLTVATPIKTYRLKKGTLLKIPKKELVRQLTGKLRKDAWIGNKEYRNVLGDLKNIVRSFSGRSESASTSETPDLAEGFQRYRMLLQKLENLRKIDQKKLLEFAGFLKDKEGQKNVFLFYQREYIPKIEPRIMQQMIMSTQENPNLQFDLMGLFEFYKRDIAFDVNTVKQAYADSSIAIHFLYFTKIPETTPGILMEEHSEDIFAAFNEMAYATGGIADSSANPKSLFRMAENASENYYLLYYTPKNYKIDGKFKNIKVKVKGKSYRISCRAGYYAN